MYLFRFLGFTTKLNRKKNQTKKIIRKWVLQGWKESNRFQQGQKHLCRLPKATGKAGSTISSR